jgi:2-methylcitrate dehydratase PrpD
MTVAEGFATEVVQTRLEDIPLMARARIQDGILDSLGVAFLAAHLDPQAKRLQHHALELGYGRLESTLIGNGSRVAVEQAAGANAQLASDTNFEETGPGMHALATFVHAGLAMAEFTEAPGNELLAAVCLAYDVNARLARAAFPTSLLSNPASVRDPLFPGHFRHYGACVALVAARLLRLNEGQTANAITLGWRYAAPPQHLPNTGLPLLGEAFNLGACVWGVQAAMLARLGYAGVSRSIEYEDAYDIHALMNPPEPHYSASHELHLKPWVGSRGFQPAIWAILKILRRKKVAVADIGRIIVRAKYNYLQPPASEAAPTSYSERKSSVPWCVAMAILGVQPGPQWLEPGPSDTARALQLAKLVQIEELERASEIWRSGVMIANEAPNEVEVITRSGTTYAGRETYASTPGSAQRPMPRGWLRAKFVANVEPVLGSEGAAGLFKRIERLAEEPNIGLLASIWRGPTPIVASV